MEPIYRNLDPIEPRIIPTASQTTVVDRPGWFGDMFSSIIADVTEPIRRPDIDPGIEVPFVPMPVVPKPYPADEDLMPPLDISVPKAVPGGLKLWHLLIGLGVLFLMKKR